MELHGDERLVVDGLLDGRRVRAVWERGAVTGDLELLLAAGAVIARGTEIDDGNRLVRASYATLGSAVVALCTAIQVVGSVQVTTSNRAIDGSAAHDGQPTRVLQPSAIVLGRPLTVSSFPDPAGPEVSP
jgi:hypothetical protein